VQLATSTLRSLALYRNGSKAGNIPRPLDMSSTKISGLQPDTEYSFYLVLRTSGGTYTSNTLTVKTHSMSNLTGITVTPGILPPQLRESLETAIERIGAKIVDTIRIDTTHFVCTEGRGRDWEKANEMNIPIVRPEWVEGCEREGKLIGVRGYYLDANPKHRQIGSNPSLSTIPTNTQKPPAPLMSPASEDAVRASQVELPPRPQQPISPDRESVVSGEPGPEVPPTPPAKEDTAANNGTKDEATEDEDEEDVVEEEEEETDGAEEEREDEAAGEGSDDEEQDITPQKDTQKSSTSKPGGGDMEDVAL
jgi:chitin biosynthesis protein CHS5